MLLGFVVQAATPNRAAALNDQLANLHLDAARTYHVRDLRLDRSGVKIYLNDGLLAFTQPLAGKVVAAVFITRGIEAGDAEVLALPPTGSERTSLARYTKRPNLNDHFGTAVFFFSDDTLRECLQQIQASNLLSAPEMAPDLFPTIEPVVQHLSSSFNLNLVEALLDQHDPKDGFFFATFAGRDLGTFSLLYDPLSSEPVTFGQMNGKDGHFQLWTSYRSPKTAPLTTQPSRFSDYRVHAQISSTLRLSADAVFHYQCDAADGHSLRFDLSDKLSVTSASVDGQPAEFFGRRAVGQTGDGRIAGAFLVVVQEPLRVGIHEISVHYEGEVIRRTAKSTYFVEERNTWYPRAGNTAAVFDLTFDCPQALQLVSTGELVSNSTANGVRTVHRRTPVPQNFVGFNLGDYRIQTSSDGSYAVDVFANRSVASPDDLAPRTLAILKTYSQWWSPLPIQSLAVTPISGYFGQGFPGLIYLSDVSYIRLDDRPASLRGSRLDSFFSDLLLPHEIAHQWWGNLVSAADYRVGWLTEAMASHSAIEYAAHQNPTSSRSAVLASYKKDLRKLRDGQPTESLGPVDFGVRLLDEWGLEVWHTITYEKGAWILRMLQTRLGDERWRQLQLNLLTTFTSRPLTNDALRQSAAQLLPPGQPDRDLRLFFDTWVYGTGIPRLALSRHNDGLELEMSGVPDDFSADIPLTCGASGGRGTVRWVRANPGTTLLPGAEKRRNCSLPPSDQFLYDPD